MLRVQFPMAFRIFISHSSHTEPDREFVRKLAAALTMAGYQVLLDKNELQAADDWNEEIHEWLAACHAGILLLTPHSIGRPWVLKEATILTWRRSLDKNRRFKLFPKVFDGVTAETLEEAKFAPLVISAIQQVAAESPESIAAEIAQIIGAPVETETPLDHVAKVLADLLTPPRAGASTAEKLARKLGIDEQAWVPNSPADLARISLIAGRLVRESLGTYGGVSELLQDLLETMSQEFARKALTVVAPYWVSADAAGRICEIWSREGGERWAIAMNGGRLGEFTVGMYLLRAFPLRGQYYQLKVRGGWSEDMIAEAIGDIEESLQRLWGVDDRDSVRTVLDGYVDPLFVVLPREASTQDVLAALRAEFPAITFILTAGDAPETLAGFSAGPRVEILNPPLKLVQEKRAYSDYVRAGGLLRV